MTLAGPDFTTILRLVFADGAPDNVVLSTVPIPNGSPVCAPGSASVTDLFSLCCPLPLAVDHADFTTNLLLGFVLLVLVQVLLLQYRQ